MRGRVWRIRSAAVAQSLKPFLAVLQRLLLALYLGLFSLRLISTRLRFASLYLTNGA